MAASLILDYICANLNTKMYIDTHTHLFSEQFDADRHEMVQRSIDAGVTEMYLPNIDSGSLSAMNELAAAFPKHCFPMMGLHPCSVKENFEEEVKLVETELATGKYYGVGETGLDYHWDLTFQKEQKEALRQQISFAKRFELPIILHTRSSFEDTFELIAEQNDESLTGVFHCFGGTLEQAQMIEELGGFYVGIGGVSTFKKSSLVDVLPNLNPDLIVLETDSPYLAPTPHRGKRNESAYLPLIAEKIAALKEIDVQEVAEFTTRNAKKLYKRK